MFEAFIHSFTTYRPLLLKIRAAFEEALHDALASQADNIHMKAQLAVLHERQVSSTCAMELHMALRTYPWFSFSLLVVNMERCNASYLIAC